MNGKPFLDATAAERLALLERIAANEGKPEKPEEHFFKELKSRVVDAYYTSEIGIKQELEYRGPLPRFVVTESGRTVKKIRGAGS